MDRGAIARSTGNARRLGVHCGQIYLGLLMGRIRHGPRGRGSHHTRERKTPDLTRGRFRILSFGSKGRMACAQIHKKDVRLKDSRTAQGLGLRGGRKPEPVSIRAKYTEARAHCFSKLVCRDRFSLDPADGSFRLIFKWRPKRFPPNVPQRRDCSFCVRPHVS
jgi:hypothetical protein